MLHKEFNKRFIFFTTVSFFLFFTSPLFSYAQTEEVDAVFILKGSTRLANGKPAERVDLELKKNGQTVQKITSGKNGKFNLQMDVSITNPDNEYLLFISQIGTIPKKISINTYIPKEEFNLYAVPQYEFDLEISMIETTKKDIVVERPSGKIHWDNTDHAFAFDQVYAKIIQKEEEKLKDDPDKYFKELAKKVKAEEEKSKAEQTAQAEQQKIDEEAKKLADQKAKAEADKILQQNLEAMKQEIKKKHIQDSLDKLAAITAGKTTMEIKKFSKPVSAADVDPNAFDGTGAFSINIAIKSQKTYKEKMSREKAANLSTKYETSNTLTSLLDVVDVYDKNEKLKAKSQKE